mgnify:CR=1 FL=1
MLLKVAGLCKTFSDNKKAIKAVNNLNFSVDYGDITVFLGPNGAGKTTTIKLILNLINCDHGNIYFQDKIIKNNFGPLLKNTGAMLEGSRNLFINLTPTDNFKYWGRLRGLSEKEAIKRGSNWLKEFGLENKKDTQMTQLSRGMQQIIAITIALLGNPKLLILDEPTLGLDVAAVNKLTHILKKIAKSGVGILITTHQLDFAQEIGKKLLLINKGLLEYFGNINDVNKIMGNEQIYTFKVKAVLTQEQLNNLTKFGHLIKQDDTKQYQIELKPNTNFSEFLSALSKYPVEEIEENKISLIQFIKKMGKEK